MTAASSYIRSLGREEIPLSDALQALAYYPGEGPSSGDSSYTVIEDVKIAIPMSGLELLHFVVEPRMRDKWGRYEEAEEFTHPLGINARHAGKKSSRTLVRYRSFRPYITFGILKDVAKTENAQLFLFMCELQKEAELHIAGQLDTRLVPATPQAVILKTDEVRKRVALINEVKFFWPSIDRDLRDAARNGLSSAAKHTKNTFWKVQEALNWATERGKVLKENAQSFISINPENALSPMLRSLLKLD